MESSALAEAWADRSNTDMMAALVRRFGPSLSPDERHDVMVDAMVACLRGHRDSFGQSFRGSLFRHTVWKCRNAVRSRTRRLRREKPTPNEELDAFPAPGDDSLWLRECLAMLGPRDSRAIRQHYFERLSCREMAAANGCGRSTAHDGLRRAVAHLRTLYLKGS